MCGADVVSNSVFYEMLAGQPPFAAKGLSSLINKVVNDDPEPLPSMREDVPEIVWWAIKKMLAKDIANRYKTGADIVRDLDEVRDTLERSPVMLTDEQKIEKMRKLAFFSQFSKNELKEVSKAATWRNYVNGEAVFTEDDKERAFFVLVEGSISISIYGRGSAIWKPASASARWNTCPTSGVPRRSPSTATRPSSKSNGISRNGRPCRARCA